MTRNMSLLASLDNCVKIKLKLINDNVVYGVGKGVVSLFTKLGERKNIS